MNVVIGIGNPYRRDDGVGPALADRLSAHRTSTVDVVVLDGEPTGLLDAWAGVPLAVVVDAVLCDPAEPGRIHRTELGEPLCGRAVSSHAMGVPEAVRLGAALGRLPGRLVMFAVEAADVGHGVGLSPEVAAALPELLDAVLAELRTE